MNNSIRVSCSRKNLKEVRDFVIKFLNTYNLSDIVLNQMVLAVDEICANLIIHANGEDPRKYLELEINKKKTGFEFLISDSGKFFQQANYKEPNIQEHIRQGKKGGVGIALVNRIMDEVEFNTEDGRNLCRLFKKTE